MLTFLRGFLNAFKGKADMERIVKVIAQDNPDEFAEKMNNFIESAKAGNIEPMLTLTSPITRQRHGDDALRHLYATQYVELFKLYPHSRPGSNSEYINDAGGRGWRFTNVFASDKGPTTAVSVVVLREQGALYVCSVSAKP